MLSCIVSVHPRIWGQPSIYESTGSYDDPNPRAYTRLNGGNKERTPRHPGHRDHCGIDACGCEKEPEMRTAGGAVMAYTWKKNGAGTFFGPDQLPACIQEIKALSDAIVLEQAVDDGPQPPYLSDEQRDSDAGKVSLDDHPPGRKFGSIDSQPASSYTKGAIVEAVFWSAHPRNTLTYMMDQGKLTLYPFAQVEKNINGQWTPVVFDWDPELIYRWSRYQRHCSKCEITWDTQNAAPGRYRIHHQGHWKRRTGVIMPYDGYSKVFRITD